MYDVIAMDPPWLETGGCGKGADSQYDTVDYRAMPHVILSSPLWRLNPRGSLVFCWTTVTSCERAFWLLRILGVKPVSKLYWLKDRSFVSTCPTCGYEAVGIATLCRNHHCTSAERPVLKGRLGLGQYTRHDVEEVIIGRVGKVLVPRLKDRSWVIAKPSKRHSEKPDEMYDLFDKIARGADLEGPRAELFARDPRKGWSVWGNEVETT